MPISEAHSAAARENSARCTGPVTPEGNAKSSQNARKLGLFGPVHLLEGYLDELSPQSILEHRYVRAMVNPEWRLSLLRDAMIGFSDMRNRNVQNEAKPAPPFNPTVHTNSAPNSTIPNLLKG